MDRKGIIEKTKAICGAKNICQSKTGQAIIRQNVKEERLLATKLENLDLQRRWVETTYGWEIKQLKKAYSCSNIEVSTSGYAFGSGSQLEYGGQPLRPKSGREKLPQVTTPTIFRKLSTPSWTLLSDTGKTEIVDNSKRWQNAGRRITVASKFISEMKELKRNSAAKPRSRPRTTPASIEFSRKVFKQMRTTSRNVQRDSKFEDEYNEAVCSLPHSARRERSRTFQNMSTLNANIPKMNSVGEDLQSYKQNEGKKEQERDYSVAIGRTRSVTLSTIPVASEGQFFTAEEIESTSKDGKHHGLMKEKRPFSVSSSRP